jgi:hypothetical protein
VLLEKLQLLGEVLTGRSVKRAVFWDVALCGLADNGGSYTGYYCLNIRIMITTQQNFPQDSYLY